MKDKRRDYQIKEFPKNRQLTAEMYEFATSHHVVHGLLEYDLTKALDLIKQKEEKGYEISLTAFFIYCFTKAIKENQIMNAMRMGKRKIIFFDDLDIAITIEVDKDWMVIPLLRIIRSVNKKTFSDINNEI